MKIKCSYCGSLISDTDEVCPNCGAPNENVVRTADGVPKTIEELKAFCASHKMPLEQMRFFIGIDYKNPKAFGIYKDDNGDFVVYKNKADGTRAVRYRGKDEAYAVNEIYQKLKSELIICKEKNGSSKPNKSYSTVQSARSKSKSDILWTVLIIIASIIIILTALFANISSGPSKGYYTYDDTYYYYDSYDDYWYYYDFGGWYPAYDIDSELQENYSSYYSGGYDSSFGASDFSDSEYYVDHSYDSGNDSWDDDWDSNDWDSYDYDSWDAGDSDWDSDW